jgi:hypothetical protein
MPLIGAAIFGTFFPLSQWTNSHPGEVATAGCEENEAKVPAV